MSALRIFNWLGSVVGAATFAVVTFTTTQNVFAATETIQFPDNELATESVYPVFDHPEGVKQRLVPTARRIELGVVGSYALTEPFYNPLSFGIMGSYHLNETHAINLLGLSFLSGTSNYSDQINETSNIKFNAQYAPAPKYLFLGSYQYTAYYGKISLSKDTVMNLGLYGLLGIGMIGIGDASNPVFSLGIGQKFYLNRSFAFRFDLRALAYQGPDITSRNRSAITEVESASLYEKTLQFGSHISAGIIYLFPGF